MKSIQHLTESENSILTTDIEVADLPLDHSTELTSSNGIDTNTKRNALLPTQRVRLKKEAINIRYAAMGDPKNPPLLLLHGVPENLQAWYAVAPPLSKNFYVIAVDWPGFGGSDPLEMKENYTSRHFAEVIVDFMDTMDIPKAHLVATDISLLPALLVGLEYPDRVIKLAVMDGIPFPRPQYSSWELKSFARKGSIIAKALVSWFPWISAQIVYIKGFYRGHSIPKEVRQEFAKDGKSKAGQEAFLSYFQNFRKSQEYFETRAKELKTPVLVLWGQHDRFINKKLGQEIAETLPNAELKIIEKTGHYVHMDNPKELARAVTEYLEQTQRAAQIASVTKDQIFFQASERREKLIT